MLFMYTAGNYITKEIPSYTFYCVVFLFVCFFFKWTDLYRFLKGLLSLSN